MYHQFLSFCSSFLTICYPFCLLLSSTIIITISYLFCLLLSNRRHTLGPVDSFESGPHFCKECLLQNLLSCSLCFAFYKSSCNVFCFLQNFWSSTKIKKLKLQRTWRMVLFNIKTDNFPPLLQPVYSLSEFLGSVSEWLPLLQNLEKPGKIIAAVTIMDLNQGPPCSPHSCCCSCQSSAGDGDGDDNGDGNGDDDSDDYAALLVMLMLMVNLDLQSSKLVQLPI